MAFSPSDPAGAESLRSPGGRVRFLVLRWLPLILYLTVLAWVAWPSLGGRFEGDDFIWLYEGRHCQGPADLFRVHYFGFVRPMSNAFFALGAQVWGLWRPGYQVAVLFMLLATALAVHVLVRRGTGSTGAATVAGLFFLVYRWHGESVFWMAAVGEVLAGLFGVLAILAIVEGPRSVRARGACLGLLACTLLSKEVALVVPALLLGAEGLLVTREPGESWRAILARHAPYWGLAAGFAAWEAWTIVAARGGMDYIVNPLAGTDAWWALVRNILAALGGPSAVQGLGQPVAHPPGWHAAACFAVALACLGLAAWAWRRARLLAFGLLCLVVTCAPYALFIPGQPAHERYTYLPSLGLAFMVGWAADRGMRSSRRLGRAAACVCLVGLLAWNAAHLRDFAETLVRDREARPDEAVQVRRLLRGLEAGACVYVYVPQRHESYSVVAVALYGDLPLSRVKEWHEVLARSDMGDTDRFLFWERSQGYTDLTAEMMGTWAWMTLRVNLPVADAGQRPVLQVVRRWGAASLAEGAEWKMGLVSGLPPDHAHGLTGPPLGITPFSVVSVDVDMVASVEGEGDEEVLLGWVTDSQVAFCGATVRQGTTLVFVPADQRAWWSGRSAPSARLARPALLQH